MINNCSKCLLPEPVPGSDFKDGICGFCRNFDSSSVKKDEEQRCQFEKDLEKTLTECRARGDYDCLVAFSGGKDSVYLLHKLTKEYKLKVLAYTGNFDQPEIAQRNIQRTIECLGVDHISYTPPREFYRKFIRYLLQNQLPQGAVYTVCYFWLNLREGDMLRLAMDRNIPVILTGYSPGQPEPSRMLYEMSQSQIQSDWTPKELFEEGLFHESERSRFWNGTAYAEGTEFPRMLAPFHAWKYDQAEVISTVVKLGLVKNKMHANPLLSNFTLNWLFMYSDLKLLGYNPYMPEFAQLIREGKASYWFWRIFYPLADWMITNQVLLGSNIKKGLQWLDLTTDDLKMKGEG